MALRAPRVETTRYKMGGFHPVHLGDTFKKYRYKVIHKLGHGGFATVWLARDSTRQRYVALKILAARLSHDCPEVEILRRLRNGDEGLGKAFVMSMLDHFWIEGPNGTHLCVVSEVGGPSIKHFNDCPGIKSGSRRLMGAVARKVALQATQGLAYIHSTGTVHGDFTAANILLQLANIDEWTIEQVHERLGAPQIENLNTTPNDKSSPRYSVNTIDMKLVDPRWLSDRIMIIDFGIAFLQEDSSTEIGTPKAYCAPEFNFGRPRSINSDIWALGCTLFEIRTGVSLFRYRGVPTRDQILISMVQLLGKLPEIWWSKWEEGRQWFDLESKAGGDLVKTIRGTLHNHIMEIGVHDGDPSVSPQKNPDFKHNLITEGSKTSSSAVDTHRYNTDQLIALVDQITTSEAAEVIAQVDKPSSSSSQEQSTSGSSAKKTQSTSSSSQPKSGEKSVPSEGISTSVPASTGNIGRPEEHSLDDLPEEKTVIATFLETSGTVISAGEADGMEDLLREALAFLPLERLAALQLAKHHWFFNQYEVSIEADASGK